MTDSTAPPVPARSRQAQPRCSKRPAYLEVDTRSGRIDWRTDWFTGGSRRQFSCPQGGSRDVDDTPWAGTYGTGIRWKGRRR